MFASLAIRNFRLFFLGQLISLTGSWAMIIAQDWLVLELTNNSATALGTVTALQFAPVLLFTLYAGLIADRFSKRRALMVVLTAQMVSCLVMGVVVSADLAQVWHVYLFAVVSGVTSAFEKPIRQAFLPEMVGGDLLANAVSLNSATFNATRLIGPAVGGLLIVAVGVGPTFLLNGFSYLAVLASLAGMRLSRATAAAPAREGQLREVLQYVRGRSDLLLVGAMGAVVGAFAMNLPTLLSLRARSDFGLSPAHLGMLSSALAAGALVGALATARSKRAHDAPRQLWLAAGLGVALLGVAVSTTFITTLVALVPVGGLLIGHNTVAQARVQTTAPTQLRGRLMALYLLVFFGGAPFGATVLGRVADAFGTSAAFIVMGIIILIASGVLGVARVWRHGIRLRFVTEPVPKLVVIRPILSGIDIPQLLPRVVR